MCNVARILMICIFGATMENLLYFVHNELRSFHPPQEELLYTSEPLF